MTQLDISPLVTAFVISAGSNPNFEPCLEALRNQTVKVNIDIIKDYRPMSVAFQQMLVRCKTPYYIEVDEDMVLNPDAVEILYKAMINEQNPKVAMLCFQLLDTHIDFVIYGIKIYKFSIFKRYPYDLTTMSCEVEQLERMKLDGYTYKLEKPIVGKHSPFWSDELIFERYLNLMEKYKEFGYTWIGSLPSKLLEIFKREPTNLNLFALLGACTSIASNERLAVGEKDFTYKRQEFTKLQSFIEQPVSATLYVTNKCNLKCRFCWRQHKDLEDFPDMSIDTIADLLYKFPTITSVCVCGFGEPFLCSNIHTILGYFKRPAPEWLTYNKSIYVGLVTNGTLLAAGLPGISDRLPDYISVSLNAPNREHYLQITGSDLFDQVLDGVRASVKVVPTFLSYVCDKTNLQYAPEFLRLAKQLGVQGVHLHNLLPHFDDNENMKFWDMVLTKDDQPAIDAIKQLPESDIITTYPVTISKDKVERNCQFPWKTIGVNGNGSITICNSVAPPRRENGVIADLRVWQNDYCQKFRELKAGEQCESCKKCFRNW